MCLQETNLNDVCDVLANEILGPAFAYAFLPAIGTAGGVLLGWHRERVMVSDFSRGRHSISAKIKLVFLDELLAFRNGVAGPWCVCGDFNMILNVADKNNDRIDRRGLAIFRAFVNRVQLEEISLTGRRFTWSSRTDSPTLVLLDRVFVTAEWLSRFPNHLLKPLSSDCSDHCPILLSFDVLGRAKRRFRFEAFWAKMHGFSDVVAAAWASTIPQADPFRSLDHKFRNVAKALKRWSSAQIGNVRLQLLLTREAILVLDGEMERRQLLPHEAETRRALKMRVLGLAGVLHVSVRGCCSCAKGMQTPNFTTCRLVIGTV